MKGMLQFLLTALLDKIWQAKALPHIRRRGGTGQTADTWFKLECQPIDSTKATIWDHLSQSWILPISDVTGNHWKIHENPSKWFVNSFSPPFIHTTFGLYLRPRPWRLKPPAGVWPLITALQAIGRSELRRSQSWQAGNLEVGVMVKTQSND